MYSCCTSSALSCGLTKCSHPQSTMQLLKSHHGIKELKRYRVCGYKKNINNNYTIISNGLVWCGSAVIQNKHWCFFVFLFYFYFVVLKELDGPFNPLVMCLK